MIITPPVIRSYYSLPTLFPFLFLFFPHISAGVYIMENSPPPGGGGEISADVIWGKKYEKAKRKRGKMLKKKEEREKKKEERGKKMRKGEVKG
jgi:hypothetical protein